MTPESPKLPAGSASWIPLLPLLAGAGLLAALAFQLRAPVHIAGDGALKQYVLANWLESGSVTSRIDWRSPQPWTAELWEDFHYPFEAPFVHEGRVVFPPFFLVLSLPLFASLGFAGLFILPALSALGLWVAVWVLLRRLEAPALPAALGLAILVLSPLTYFGMMFWEHTPGLLALFAALVLLTRRGGGAAMDAAGGWLLALAVMLRPELAAAAAVLLLFALTGRPRRIAAFGGLVGGMAIWAGGNLLVTGTLVGLHARQPLMLSGGDALPKLLGYYSNLGAALTAGAAGAVAGLVGAAVLVRNEKGEVRRLELCLLVMVAVTLAVVPFMIPYDGEYMGFRRFELLLIPAGAALAGRLAVRFRWAGPLLLGLCVLQAPRMARQFEVFRWASGPRLGPVIETLRAERPSIIVGDSQFTAIELSPLMGEVPLVWAAPPNDLLNLLAEAGRHADLARAAIVFWNPGASTELTLPVPDRAPVVWARRAGDDEGFAVFMPASEAGGS